MAAAPATGSTPVGVIIGAPMNEHEMDYVRSGAAAPSNSCAGDQGVQPITSTQGTAAHECSSACEFLRRGIRLARLAKLGAIVVIMAACMFWLGWWILSPEPEARHKYVDIWIGDKTANSRFFNTDGQEGSSLVFHAVPFAVVAMLSFVVIHLRASIRAKEAQLQRLSLHAAHIVAVGADAVDLHADDQQMSVLKRIPRNRSWRLSTYPLWVGSGGKIIGRVTQRVGIITAAEALGIVVLLLVITYHMGRSMDLNFHRIARTDRAPSVKHWQKVSSVLRVFGEAALLPFALLWIPVSRGSPLLRAARIPFEHAVRYHVWLAAAMIAMLSVHSLGYIIMYTVTGKAHKIVEWETGGERCAIAAGLAAWIVALAMLLTSLPRVRRRRYELFFYAHHLYLLFALLWMYHVVSHVHYFIVPMLLFFVDRLLRMLQSARLVRVSAVRLHADSVVELTLPLPPLPPASNKSAGLMQQYSALSTWCVQIPGISALQWHFFSGASSPLDKSGALSILVKPLGGWTNALRRQFPSGINIMPTTAHIVGMKSLADHPQYNSTASASASGAGPISYSCPFSFKARVDGPYGDDSDFYLKYKSLVLVAGGIGITPVLAILRDILYRYKHRYDEASTSRAHERHYDDLIAGLPSSITIYHCIRRAEDLHVLDYVCPDEILPGYDALGLRIRIHVYVTGRRSSSLQQAAEGSADDIRIGALAAAPGDRNQQSPGAVAGSQQLVDDDQGRIANRQMILSSRCMSLSELWQLRQRQIKQLAPTPKSSSAISCSSHGTDYSAGSSSSSAPLVFLPADADAATAPISMMSSTGDTSVWVGCASIASIVGYFLLSGFANTVIIRSHELHHRFSTNYNRVHLAVASMAMAILLFGGLVLFLRTIFTSRAAAMPSSIKGEMNRRKQGAMVSSSAVQPLSHSVGNSPIRTLDHVDHDIVDTFQSPPADHDDRLEAADGEANYAGVAMANGRAHVGCRPDWRDVFDGLAKTHCGESVGVLVSGSQGIQEDVARECRRHSSSTLFNRVKNYIGADNTSTATNANVIFHYHSISFSL